MTDLQDRIEALRGLPLSADSLLRVLCALLRHVARRDRRLAAIALEALDDVIASEPVLPASTLPTEITIREVTTGEGRPLIATNSERAQRVSLFIEAFETFDFRRGRGRPRGVYDGLRDVERSLELTFADRRAMVRTAPQERRRRAWAFLLGQLWETWQPSPRGALTGQLIDAVMAARNDRHAARLFIAAATGRRAVDYDALARAQRRARRADRKS